jgi:hypothetical protein
MHSLLQKIGIVHYNTLIMSGLVCDILGETYKQSRTADKGWSFSLGVLRDANKSTSYNFSLLRHECLCLGPGLILW